MRLIHKYSFCLTILMLFSSCKKFLDVGNPPDKVVSDYVYNYNTSASAVLTGIYFTLQQNVQGGPFALSTFYGLFADECSTLPGSFAYDIYTNNSSTECWIPFYQLIYRINAAIEGVRASSALNPDVKRHLLGEASFLRAFCYFYLVNIYGDVPLIMGTDYKLNTVAGRSPESKVYEQMIVDLIEAKASLSEDYLEPNVLNTSSERIRPNKWAAVALLSRVYLYIQNWKRAEEEASEIINYKSLYDTVSLDNVFAKNNKEAIWQLFPVDPGGIYKNTLDAPFLVFENGPDYFDHLVWGSDLLLNSMELGDRRKTNWIGIDSSTGLQYNYFHKYKLHKPEDESGEYFMVLRMAEQYLIRSEARAQQNDLMGALSDLNIVRRRAGLADATFMTKESIVSAVLHERQVELFMEWGHRWFDLKRTNNLDKVMEAVSIQKGVTWERYKKWDAIPMNDLLLNSKLKQNDGYPAP